MSWNLDHLDDNWEVNGSSVGDDFWPFVEVGDEILGNTEVVLEFSEEEEKLINDFREYCNSFRSTKKDPEFDCTDFKDLLQPIDNLLSNPRLRSIWLKIMTESFWVKGFEWKDALRFVQHNIIPKDIDKQKLMKFFKESLSNCSYENLKHTFLRELVSREYINQGDLWELHL